ncbi:fructosamine kinase family protein [Cellulomonas dongxiuzhuiae]|uniref:Fructosamine kinase family protein n=1 Tax=Cellulomonas dongxiuzhuiae TaxID=2819979 RepID=A0ABX8GFY2_9CELL|nr:fructosamine kinase family protein [Cellulomonas dongxiuzhuiae]MBO3093627.1 fructosamine kinase family protein [Cellulomonas dongxiuzhuiae]QWC14743.1 fructosamine kinase family protein [Cellulomonas dongxiuzhuiae]
MAATRPAPGASGATPLHRKSRHDAPHGFFACEAAGLRWLAAAGGARVVQVLEVADDHLDLVRLRPVPPGREAARVFGAALARTHDAGAEAFGVPPDGWRGDSWFGPLDAPLPMRAGRYDAWGAFLAECRVAPVARALRDAGLATRADEAAFDRLRGLLHDGRWDDPDPPARVHGDLWQGNVVWTDQGVTLIDPAAHGGHRESDLAMLALFGLPHLQDVLDGYQEAHPLHGGWRHRVGLHQLYPVAVHALLFGSGYVEQTRRLLHAVAPA